MEPSNMDVNDFNSPYQLTRSMQRDLYPALDPKNPDLSASGKVVIITEGRVGFECAKAWATAGAAGIILVGRSAETLNRIAGGLKTIAGSAAIMVQSTDITKEYEVTTLYEKIVTKFEVVDVLITDGVTLNIQNTGDIAPDLWWRDFECHVKGPYLLSHCFIKYFGAKGTIINLSSLAIGMVMPGLSSYSASKLAMAKTSEYLQKEHPNMRVFCCMPGISEKPMTPELARPYAVDNGMLTGAMSLYLSTPRADYLKGSLVSATWDTVEMEQHKDEIVKNRLLNLAFLNAELGPEGHPWET